MNLLLNDMSLIFYIFEAANKLEINLIIKTVFAINSIIL
ncbi:hypothetical protein SAMN05444280_11790 [Tangfeifania diversioriginum]|uniref:Uncharacterized protein n=1 Tax=Tangfeifania diversioriginum TaxID=1168035 RepID=A0A1M6IR17_9BACT|nr:hypothetical protein SAMN05444280_11790 [Tangfeifania diversioriginum]